MTAEDYLQLPVLQQPRLSPDGTRIAVRVLGADGHYNLVVGLSDGSGQSQAVPARGAAVTDFFWKGDDQIILSLVPRGSPPEFAAYDLKSDTLKSLRRNSSQARLVSPLFDAPDEILVAVFTAPERNEGPGSMSLIYGRDLVRLNVRTGKEKIVERDPGMTQQWFVNQAGEAVASWGTDGRNPILWYRSKAGAKWQRATQLPKNGPGKLQPLGLAADQKRLVLADYRKDAVGELVYFDPASGKTTALPGAGPAGRDPRWENWGARGDAGAVVTTVGGEVRRTFLDSRAEKLQHDLAGSMSGGDLTPESFSRDESRLVIRLESARTSGEYLLLEPARASLVRLGALFPRVTPAALAPVRAFGFKTAAGLDVSGEILLPAGRARPPLIIFHPPMIGSLASPAQENELHYFATQGFAVAVLGRPPRHAADSILEGVANEVEEDLPVRIEAAIKWLADQGWVDGGKVAVAGRFLGGIPAFVAVTPPDLVKAFVNLDSPLTGAPSTQPTGIPIGRGVAAAGGGTLIPPSAASVQVEARDRVGLNSRLPRDLPSVPSWHYYTVLAPPTGSPALRGLSASQISGSGAVSVGGAGLGGISGPRIAPPSLPISSGVISIQSESAARLVDQLKKRKQVAELVSSVDLARELGLSPNEAPTSPRIRARRDELIVAFLKQNGLD